MSAKDCRPTLARLRLLDGQAVELRGRLVDLPQETSITLRVDAGTPFARFVSVVEVIQGIGLRNLGVITEKRR